MLSLPLRKTIRLLFLSSLCLLLRKPISAQTNLLLNGGFEDINTCTEYNSECGVEAWFYLKDVKAQMLSNDSASLSMGGNSFGLFFNWLGYTGFSPLLGTVLPCSLQKDKRYTFKGMVSAKLNPKLILKPGIVTGEKFYVPRRKFSANMHPDSITQIKRLPNSGFYRFEFSFIATGTEKYLTFGTFIEEDTLAGKKTLIGVQTVSVILDNFELLTADTKETFCTDFLKNKKEIYSFNFRHKEMDYSLYGRGDLAIVINEQDSNNITREEIPELMIEKKVMTDTLKLGDVFFDFNKAKLKPGALQMLESYFKPGGEEKLIDSIYVEGHTDSVGTDTRNMQLSWQRCESVETWLQQNNILANDQIQIHPFGEIRPIASNSSQQGRALNRRVEMIIFRKTKK
jgi:outer membrane protein OmpA-like peptidoglycan-associated protein